MSELTLEARGGVLRTLPELEAAIGYYKRQTAEGIIGIGAALNEAKEQLGHGEWLPWLEKVQINARAAQNYMRVAREIAPGSAMAALPYTKALALLDAPQETREQLLDEGVDDKSAAEIRRLTKELENTKRNLQTAEAQQKSYLSTYERQERENAKLKNQVEVLLTKKPEKITVEVAPADYEDLKETVATLRAQLRDAEAAIEEAETRGMQPMGADEDEENSLTAAGFVEACNEFMAKVQFYPYYKTDLEDIGDEGRRSMEIFTHGVQNWAVRMLGALAAAGGRVDCGGAVTADV